MMGCRRASAMFSFKPATTAAGFVRGPGTWTRSSRGDSRPSMQCVPGGGSPSSRSRSSHFSILRRLVSSMWQNQSTASAERSAWARMGLVRSGLTRPAAPLAVSW